VGKVRRTIGRRALFFFALVVISLALYYPTPPGFRWVCLFTASLAAFWCLAFALEDLTGPAPVRPARSISPLPVTEPESPFAPPPPPGAGGGAG